MRKDWRMPEPCRDCPFNKSGPGLRLRRSLASGRMAEIKRGLRRGDYFTCHKTTVETGNGSRLLCAGALAYQEAQGVSSNYQRVCERIEWIQEHRAPAPPRETSDP